MNNSSETTAASESAARRWPLGRILTYTGRLAFGAAVLWAAYSFLWPAGEEPPPPAPDHRESERLQAALYGPQTPLALADLLSGNWRFAGAAWRVQMAARDAVQPDQPPRQRRGNRQLGDLDRDVLQMFAAFPSKRDAAGEFQRIRVTLGNCEVTAYTSQEPGVGELLESLKIVQGGADERSLLAIVPGDPATDLTGDGAFRDGPPLESLAELKATRWTDDDLCVGALIEPKVDLVELRRAWRKAGWTVDGQPVDDGSPLLLRRGPSLWSATFFPASGDQPLLLLARVPEN